MEIKIHSKIVKLISCKISLSTFTSSLIHVFLVILVVLYFKGSGDLMDKVSASQPGDRGLEPHTGHDNDSHGSQQ